MEHILEHHGILGMKWGVRRFQNEDGSLTAAGKRRYRTDADPPHEDYLETHPKKSVSRLSDAELRRRINRLQMEQQYVTLVKEPKSKGQERIERGKKMLEDVLFNSGKAIATKYVTQYATKGIDKMLGNGTATNSTPKSST